LRQSYVQYPKVQNTYAATLNIMFYNIPNIVLTKKSINHQVKNTPSNSYRGP